MNYRYITFPNGCRFFTTWDIFITCRRETEKIHSRLHRSMMTEEDFDNFVLGGQAESLDRQPVAGRA